MRRRYVRRYTGARYGVGQILFRGTVFGALAGLILGAAVGTVAALVVGTLFGGIYGLAIGSVLGLLCAVVLAVFSRVLTSVGRTIVVSVAAAVGWAGVIADWLAFGGVALGLACALCAAAAVVVGPRAVLRREPWPGIPASSLPRHAVR